jgi:DNA-binding GntR family transcriptional regulator
VAHDEAGAEAALRNHLEGAFQRISETMARRYTKD